MPDYKIEDSFRPQFGDMICGVDEAGRGPLCGPVCAAAVILPPDARIDGLNDSKKLSEARREELYTIIINTALSIGVGWASAEQIDELNILNATFLAMRNAVEAMPVKPSFALIDGNRAPQLQIPVKCIVKGDSLCMSIAAASVIAKVSRDRLMKELALQYPQYKLQKHKGYPTKEHYELLLKYGVAPIYRRSFLKNLDEKRKLLSDGH